MRVPRPNPDRGPRPSRLPWMSGTARHWSPSHLQPRGPAPACSPEPFTELSPRGEPMPITIAEAVEETSGLARSKADELRTRPLSYVLNGGLAGAYVGVAVVL